MKCTRRAFLPTVSAVCAVSIFSPLFAFAADRNWISPGGGSYDVPSNWSSVSVPAPEDNAVFGANAATAYTVTFPTARSITQVAVNNDKVIFNLGNTTYTATSIGTNALLMGSASSDAARLNLQNGTLSLSGGATLAGGNLNTAILTVESGGAAAIGGNLTIGAAGAGTFTIQTGGSGNCTSLLLANSATARGTASVAGAMTARNVVQVGQYGTGSLSITGSGVLTAPSCVVGNLAGAGGFGSISGGGMMILSSSLLVGNFGAGTFDLNGGTISCSQVTIGSDAAAVGSMSVRGSTSRLTVGAPVIVGGAGVGSLVVSKGAAISGAPAYVGQSGAGLLELRDVGTTGVFSSMTLGSSVGGAGTLNVLNGASLTTGSTILAGAIGANATAWIGGAGARWTCNGGFTVANGGAAVLTIEPDATLSISSINSMQIKTGGSVHLSGGTLSTGSLQLSGGSFDWDSGTLSLTGSAGLTLDAAGPLGPSVILAAGKTLTVTNTATLPSGALLHLTGGAVSAGNLSIQPGGELLLSSGDAAVSANQFNNAGLIDGDGRIHGRLVNNLTGEVRAESGARLGFSKSIGINSNSGDINLLGGTVEFADQLTNDVDGRISGRGMLSPAGGLINNGNISLSAGLTDVLGGTVINNNGAKIIVTGGSVSTFHGDFVNNAGGELRVSSGSAAVFLGNFSGAGQITGSGTKYFEGAGTVGFLATSGATVIESGAWLVAKHIRENALTVESSGVVTIAADGSASAASRIGALILAGGASPAGTIDLNDNDLILTATPRAVALAQIAQARHAGAWDGDGITSSAARNNTRHCTGLGVLSGDEYRAIYGATATFDGFAVAPSDIVIKYTYNGDTDLNGLVNFDDYSRIDTGFNLKLTGWINGDFDHNGVIGFDDYALIDSAFNLQSGTLSRAIAFVAGDDRSSNGMDSPALQIVEARLDQFGDGYAQAFLAAVPEPGAILSVGVLIALRAIQRRRAV